jgi:hypothetical protein
MTRRFAEAFGRRPREIEAVALQELAPVHAAPA